MDISEKTWLLISRNLSGEATAEERTELTRLLQEQPALKQEYALLQQVWKAGEKNESQPDPAKISRILQLSAVQEALMEKEVPVVHVNRRKKIFSWAAVVIGAILTVWSVNKWLVNSSNEPVKVVAQKGTKARTILPDGSTVWLNAGSRIVYETGFNDKIREVTLHGEAYFDVVKIVDKPFIVHAGGINIKVLGTAFNVKSYPDDKTIETTLIRGLVQITRANDSRQQPIYLQPNQKIVLPVNNNEILNTQLAEVKSEKTGTQEKLSPLPAVSYLDSNKKETDHIETAWVYNRLLFRGDNFEELAKKLERWYNIVIHFEDEDVMNLTFNGSIENETSEQAFLALKAAIPFNFKIKNNEVYISTYEP